MQPVVADATTGCGWYIRRYLFGAKRLTTSGSRSQKRAEKPAALPPLAAYPPPQFIAYLTHWCPHLN